MSYKEKNEKYRAHLRKQQRDSYITEKRMLLMYQMESDGNNTMIEQISTSNRQDFTISQLSNLAKISQTEEGIEVIKQSKLNFKLIKYLDLRYLKTDQQYWATYILCNFIYMNKDEEMPSQQFISNLFELINQGQNRTRQNILYMIHNIFSDHSNLIDKLMIQFNLCQKLTLTFRCEQINDNCLLSLLRVIYLVLTRSRQKSESIKLFKKYLFRIILHGNNITLITISVYICHTILTKFPQDTGKEMMKAGVLSKIMKMATAVKQRKFAFIILQIIGLSLNLFDLKDFKNQILIFLKDLLKVRFEFGQNSAIYTIFKFKVYAIRLIHDIMQTDKGLLKHYIEDEIIKYLLDQFRITDNPQVAAQLACTFALVLINLQKYEYQNEIENLIEKAKLLNQGNYQFMCYLHDFDTYRQK